MTTCEKCGVRVENDMEICPLCGEPVTEAGRTARRSRDERDDALRAGAHLDDETRETLRSAKIWLFEMVTLVAFTAAIIVFAADFSTGFSLSWAQIPLLGIGFVYLVVASIIGFVRTPGLLLVVETAIISGFLLLLNLQLGHGEWFLYFALPITLLVAFFFGLASAAIVRLRLNALQATATVLLAAGLFVVGLEFVLNYALHDEFLVSWSLIAFACTLSLFFLVLFINKRLRERHAEFRKVFHI